MKKTKITTPPWCPFCGQKVGRASDAIERSLSEFMVGRCGCGAVYTCDATGHNVGSAMVEAMVFACDNNWDLAWDLMPEDDYLTGRVEDYDEVTHQVVNTRNLDGRPVRGVLYFVRLHKDIAEVSRRVKAKKEQLAAQASQREVPVVPDVEPDVEPGHKPLRANKKIVRELVDKLDVDGAVRLCLDDKKSLRLMQRLLYDADEARRWRLAAFMGQVCARVATRDPGQVSQLLHRLYEACSDSAATPWGMLEAIGEIVSARTDIFGAFTRHLLSYMGDESTQPQVLRALARIAGQRSDLIRQTPFYNLFHFLQHPEPQMRGLTALLLGRIKATETTTQLLELVTDEAEFVIWEAGIPATVTVGQVAREALALIREGETK
ncbi:MAG: PBS lyase [Desulfobulbaceae bacterium]|uniref:PBS lyase n=1 Tax=Candidatus Desulfatifera sulfidica TaxID=2841691 RepID=A0A8J6N9S7_9BACT|nr:PBS lyase [Candidatus Desulfatifera sulfidica]